MKQFTRRTIRVRDKRSRREYPSVFADATRYIGEARSGSVRTINAHMTTAYRNIGRRIVEFEQRGNLRAEYGEQRILRLSTDLMKKFPRGFSPMTLRQMRRFGIFWSAAGHAALASHGHLPYLEIRASDVSRCRVRLNS